MVEGQFVKAKFDCNFLIDTLLIILICFSPLIYGSITILPLTLVEGIAFLIFFIFIIDAVLKNRISLIKAPILPIIVFALLIFFQIIPLPKDVVAFLSPKTASIYKDFLVEQREFLTLSIYREASINILIQFVAFFILFFVVLHHLDKEKRIGRLLLAFIISGIFYSFYGVIKKLSTPLPSFSTFTNRNHFAAYLEMIIPLGIAYSFLATAKIKKIIFISVSSLMTLILFLSLSRGGVVCFSLGFLMLVMLIRIKHPKGKVIGLIIGLLVLLFFFFAIVGVDNIIIRLKTIFMGLEASPGRVQVLKDAPKLIQDFLIFGTGLGTFGDIFQKYKTFPSWPYKFSHNEPLQLLIETGIVGFISIFLFFSLIVSKTLAFWFKRRYPFAIYLTLGCLIGIFSVTLHSFFEFFLHTPANAIQFFIILALGYRIIHMKDSEEVLPEFRKDITLSRSVRLILIVLSSLLFIFAERLVFKRFQAEVISMQVKEKKLVASRVDGILEYKKALNDLERAIALNPGNSAYFAQKADLLSSLFLRDDLRRELVGLEDFKNKEEILESAEDYYKKAINLNPTNPNYHLKLGWLYQLMAEKELMQEEFKKAILLDPQNEEIRSYVAGF